MPSPVSPKHGKSDNDLALWLATYRVHTPGTDSAGNATTFLLEDAPQPDGQLYILSDYGGTLTEEEKKFVGPAELIGEVCLSSTSYDLNIKLDLYEAAGVQEYLAILVHEQEIRWHILVNSRYQLLPPDADGIWRSRVFPGLWLDGAAFLKRDMQRVLAVLQSGLASPEHSSFVKHLADKRAVK